MQVCNRRKRASPIQVPETRLVFRSRAQRNAFRRDVHQQSRLVSTRIAARKAAQTPSGFAEIVGDNFPILHAGRSLTTEILRREENLARVTVFYCGSRRKTGDVDVTAI